MVVPEDKLGFSYNNDIKKRIGNEAIYFSDKIIHKTLGLFGGNLQRSILITHLSIYRFDGIEIKRRIKIEDLKGVTVSKTSNQFILHCNQNEYDVLFIYSNRKKLLKIL